MVLIFLHVFLNVLCLSAAAFSQAEEPSIPAGNPFTMGSTALMVMCIDVHEQSKACPHKMTLA